MISPYIKRVLCACVPARVCVCKHEGAIPQSPSRAIKFIMKENKATSAMSSDQGSMAPYQEIMPDDQTRTACVAVKTIQKTIKETFKKC